MLVNPGPLRTKMRAAAMLTGEDPPVTLAHARGARAAKIVCRDVALSGLEPETGKLYDFPQDKILSFQGPA